MTETQAKAVRIWLAVMLVTAIAVAFSFKHIDQPVLMALYRRSRHLAAVSRGLGSAMVLTLEAVVFLILASIRIIRGSLSPLGKAVAAACIASICAYGINANVLKVMFGVQTPGFVAIGWPHMAHFFGGSPESSFPSGHMVLAGAFAAVLMRHFPRSVVPLSGVLVVAAVLLVVGSWHFVSDVLAGAFVGVTAGLVAAEIWLAHERTLSDRF